MIDSKFSSIGLFCRFGRTRLFATTATVALDESPQAEIELTFDQYIDTFSQAKCGTPLTIFGTTLVLVRCGFWNVSISPMMPR